MRIIKLFFSVGCLLGGLLLALMTFVENDDPLKTPAPMHEQMILYGASILLIYLFIYIVFILPKREKKKWENKKYEILNNGINVSKFTMSSIVTECLKREYQGIWVIEFFKEKLIFHHIEGETQYEILAEAAEEFISFPEFEKSNVKITNETLILDLLFSKKDLFILKNWMNDKLVEFTPESVGMLLRGSVYNFLLGCISILIGVGLSFSEYQEAASNPSGEYYIYYGAVLFGIIMFIRCIQKFIRYRKLKAL